MARPGQIIAAAEQVWKRSGLETDRSDRSETRYVTLGWSREWSRSVKLRVSFHELGWADYGSRRQSHSGPEAIVERDATTLDIHTAALEAVREFVADGGPVHWEPRERAKLAETLRTLRRIVRRMNDPAYQLAQARSAAASKRRRERLAQERADALAEAARVCDKEIALRVARLRRERFRAEKPLRIEKARQPSKAEAYSERLGRLAVEAMAAQGMTQPDLANQVGVNKSTISRWIRRERTLNRDAMDRIALALGITVELVEPDSEERT